MDREVQRIVYAVDLRPPRHEKGAAVILASVGLNLNPAILGGDRGCRVAFQTMGNEIDNGLINRQVPD